MTIDPSAATINPDGVPDGNWDEVLPLVRGYFDAIMHNGEYLDQKAWNLLSFTSSTFAIVAVLQAVLVSGSDVSVAFWVGVMGVIAIYGALAYCVFQVTRPVDYEYPIALPSADQSIDDWDAMYLTAHDRAFKQQLLTDLIGDGSEPGAIQTNEQRNNRKSRYLSFAMWTTVLLFASLVVLAAIAVIG